MKHIVIIFFIYVHLFALDIYLNSAKQNNSPYAILHIVDNEPIECHTILLALDKKSYICRFKKIVKNKLGKKKLRFVNIDFLEKDKEFYIKIDPKYGSKLLSLSEELFKLKEIKQEISGKKSKHWVVLLFKKLPFGKKVKSDGINFPITYERYMMPSVGPVDVNGAPIAYARSKDINYYLDIQKEFKSGDYESVVQDVNRAIKQYPNSIFMSDLLLYKLKSIDVSIEKNLTPISEKYTNSDVTKEAKSWLRRYASNENIPQVLLILVKNYLRAESNSDVNYFLDILINEHKKSPYTKKAILYYADSLYSKNHRKKATKLYEDVLYSAKSLDIASLAAIRLANSNINSGNTEEAKKYLLKVLDANKKYLLKDKDATAALAVKLAANKLQDIAAKLNDLLLKNIPKEQIDTRELLLKQAGDWYAETNQINKAYARYSQYQKIYKDGIYINEVNKARDRLFFKIKENNDTKLANYYDTLISKYKNDIRDKAILHKAELLIREKRYQEILNMKNLIKSSSDRNSTKGEKIIKSASIVLIEEYLQADNCQNAINLFIDNRVDFKDINNSKKLFNCLMIMQKYKKANELSKSKISSKRLSSKFYWLENLIKSDYKLQKFNKILELKQDIDKLSKIANKPISASVLRDIFNSYFYTKSYSSALEELHLLDIKYPKDIKNIEPYYKIINYANDKRDDLLLIKYAKKIISMQKLYKIHSYSPKVEFLYIDALKRVSKIKEARKVANKLLKIKMKKQNIPRVLFELGELNLKLEDRKIAKKYFQKCAKVKENNSWVELCKDSLKLF